MELQLPVVLICAACVYFLLVLAKSYKETSSQMSLGEFATANKGPLLGLVCGAIGAVYIQKGGKDGVLHFGGQQDDLLREPFWAPSSPAVDPIV